MKREFSVPRTPQQNGIAERKNKTLIKAARTMLADSLLPIPFWAEAVNTACYVQNRVLVTKPHNKTHYELLHGGTPGIGFMRPFGCPVTILNTLDPLGKFEGKVDEGFLVGYSVNSKAFGVINSRTRIVQETLHVNFLENKPNIAGDAAFDRKEHDAEKPKSAVNLSPSYSALLGEQDGMTNRKDKGKSHVEYFTRNRKLNAGFKDYSKDSSNDVSAAGPIVPIAGQNYSNITNPISVAGPSKSNTTLTHGKSSLKDAYQPSDMLEREDIAYSNHENVGAEADFKNLETSIIVSSIPTTRTHKAHPISQIIGDLSSVTQIRNDIIFGATNKALYKSFKKLMKDKFQMSSMGELTFFGSSDDIIFGATNKALYKSFEKLMKDKFQMSSMGELTFFESSGKSASTTIDTEKPLLKDSDGKDVDVHIYRSMIGSLMYLTSSRPDIMFASNDVTRLQALVDKKKVVVNEAAIRDALHLDDAEGVDCLPNEEIFIELAHLEIIKLQTRVKKLERENKVKALKLKRLRKVETSQRVDTSDDTIMEDVSNQERIIDELDKDEGAMLMNEKEETEEVRDNTDDTQVEERQTDIYQINMDHAAKVLSMQEDESEVHEAVEVVTTAKLITKVIVAVSKTVSAAAVAPTVTAAPVKVVVPFTR
nr:retrovirus-related Pol polyprotein from transposon TNT 1-94 [Tanacetum cinerariifolium]